MDSAKWPQNFPEVGLLVKQQPMEEVVSNNTCNTNTHRQMLEKKARPQEQLNCPRCNSTNTKFCYYNNYSLTQPRYFCKSCRRYWTEGGSLRNVPVGGASRKNKRSTSSSSSSASSNSNNKLPSDLNPPSLSHFSSLQNPKIFERQDINLAFQGMHNETHDISQYGIASRGLDSLIPTMQMQDSNTLYFSSGFPLQDIKPGTLSFSIDHGIENNNNVYHGHGVQENGNGSLFFPFGELKHLSSPSSEADQIKGQGTSIGYWNGMLSGGS